MRETSMAARESVDSKNLERIVFDYIDSTGTRGTTCDEAEAALRMRHQTCSARFSTLAKKGKIVDSGKRRLTRSGRRAIVWWIGLASNEQASLL